MSRLFKSIAASTNGDQFPHFGVPGFLLLAALFYNAVLAIINAHVIGLNTQAVIGVEILIILCAFGYALSRFSLLPDLRAVIAYLFISAILFLFVSIAHEQLYLKSIRDVLLIVAFFLLGGLSREGQIKRTIILSAILVLIFVIIEIWMTNLYIGLFQPASYFANTRGFAISEFNDLGLFSSATVYESRFSFGLLSHRASSLFLEQISLGNYAIFLSIFLCAFWGKLSSVTRLFIAAALIFSVIGSSGRAAIALSIIFILFYFILPYIPRILSVLYMPLILGLAFIFFHGTIYAGPELIDTVPGRIGWTVRFISEMGWSFLMGGSAEQINRTFDSGYAYILYSQTIFGLLALWLFVFATGSEKNREARYFSHCLTLFIFFNLLIGFGVFSAKIAPLLWIVAGYYKSRYADERL
jgi:hypothetical protein